MQQNNQAPNVRKEELINRRHSEEEKVHPSLISRFLLFHLVRTEWQFLGGV